jgi:EAL domain-containing protein (putative c-di-GMP-specific phosphodiesterase class I)
MGASQSQESRRTALVLDDEVQIGIVVCKMLTAIGISVSHFAEPLELLLEVKRSPPEILILDLQLGRADAVDVIRKLEILKFPGSILLISGRDQALLAEIERIGRSHGLRMLQSLAKPFRAADLKARLEKPRQLEPLRDNGKAVSENPPANDAALLEDALENNWLQVWYQPKVDLASESVCGAEALIRGLHPKLGLLGPAALLPPAGAPIYKALSIFVIRQAIQDWRLFAGQSRNVHLAVNVPASVLSAAGFVGFVREVLPTNRQFPGLIVEVTEDEVIRDVDWLHEVATQLRLYNVSLSIDDFGSAYASLSRLKDLPFRELKLDRSFVTNCATDPLKRGLCSTVVDLAHCFGAAACAEGVETLDDLGCLRELGFNTAQGFIFAEPMPSAQFLDYVVRPFKMPAVDFGFNPTKNPARSGKA